MASHLPPHIRELRNDEVGAWYWGATAGGYEATYGKYKPHWDRKTGLWTTCRVNQLPSDYLEWFIGDMKRKDENILSCPFKRAMAKYYIDLQAFMKQGRNSGLFLVPISSRMYKGKMLSEVGNNIGWYDHILNTDVENNFPLFVSAVEIWREIMLKENSAQNNIFGQPRSTEKEDEDDEDESFKSYHSAARRELEWSGAVKSPPVTPSPPSSKQRRQESNYDIPELSSLAQKLTLKPNRLLKLRIGITLDEQDLPVLNNLLKKSQGKYQIEVEGSSLDDDIVRNSQGESSRSVGAS